jgi:tRNA(fMet)-specific endonuclease VapC
MDVLIDTSVLVAWEREGRPSDVPTDAVVAISAITASELLHGVHRASTAQRRHRRELWVEAILASLV